MSRVHRTAVPSDALANLPGAHYSVAFQLEYTGHRTPEQWARALLEGGPTVWRLVLMFGWRYILGLQLGPSHSQTPWHVQGWPIATNDEKTIALTASSSILDAANVFEVGPDTVTWVTLVRYKNPVGRVLWTALAPVHQLSVPPLFIRASR